MEEKSKRFIIGGTFEIKISIPAKDRDEAKAYSEQRYEELITKRLAELLLELKDTHTIEVNLKKLNRVRAEGETEEHEVIVQAPDTEGGIF